MHEWPPENQQARDDPICVDFVSMLGHGVRRFDVRGISPLAQSENNPGFAPQLAFSEATGSFSIRAHSRAAREIGSLMPGKGCHIRGHRVVIGFCSLVLSTSRFAPFLEPVLDAGQSKGYIGDGTCSRPQGGDNRGRTRREVVQCGALLCFCLYWGFSIYFW